MPTEDWLCRKLAKLNLTLVEGYTSRGSEAGGLAKDVFLRPARTQSKWCGLHTDPKAESSLGCRLLHQHLAEYHRKHCADGRDLPGRLQLYAIKLQALNVVCLRYNRT